MFHQVDWNPNEPLRLSGYVSTFAHMGEVYLYHDLYGYILKMSPDILEFVFEFRTPELAPTVCARYANAFGDQAPEGFVGTFAQFGCLTAVGSNELDPIWDKVPVKGPWNVWERTADGGLVLYTAWGDRDVARHTLTPEQASMWDRFDGETPLFALAEEHGQAAVAALIERLVHHEVQAVKLSHVKLSFYKGRQHLKPPYLASTMPYASYDPAKDPAPTPIEDHFSPEQYYAHEVVDAAEQFDHQETTLSHLFRRPHPALQGRTYGQAMVDGLFSKGKLAVKDRYKVLEIGGGLGKVARAVVEALTARDAAVEYHIIELAPALADAQRKETAGLPVTVHPGDVLKVEWPADDYDLIISNEMVGDLPALQLTREQARLDDEELEGEAYQQWFAEAFPMAAVVTRNTVGIGDAPDPFYLNLGAMELIEKLPAHLAPGGVAWVTEFGELQRWPVLSTQLDHPELSTQFGHLTTVARAAGLLDEFIYVMDFIDMERDVQALRTTRSYFRALAALLSDHGVKLDKIGYTQAMFDELVGDALEEGSYGDVSFELIEDRLMGLVPHEFKGLVLRRPDAD